MLCIDQCFAPAIIHSSFSSTLVKGVDDADDTVEVGVGTGADTCDAAGPGAGIGIGAGTCAADPFFPLFNSVSLFNMQYNRY